MNSREKILSAVLKNQPEFSPLSPYLNEPEIQPGDLMQFKERLKNIGANFLEASSKEEIGVGLDAIFSKADRKISNISGLEGFVYEEWEKHMPHSFENVEVAVLEANFGVAENGAVWITEPQMGQRILPFICQELVLVLNKEHIVATMHDAYTAISNERYGFGVFIAGPSRTADIEQSLVLGAHGAKGLTVVLVSPNL